MDKVGFLYTIGLLLMSLTVLSLALFISDIEKISNAQVADLVKYERIGNLDKSIENGFVDIFNVASGIRFFYGNNTNNSLIIRENLPNSNSTIFIQNMTSYEKFLNKTANLPSDNITLYLNNLESIKTTMPLIIMPYNITYDHVPTFGGSTIRLRPRTFNFYGYNLSILSPVDLSSTHTWRTTTGTDMIIKINVRGPASSITKNQRISSAGMSYLTIRNTANTPIINISINNSRLFINNLAGNKLIVSTGIMMTGNEKELTRIFYPKKIYNITMPDFNLKTSSHVMLHSLDV